MKTNITLVLITGGRKYKDTLAVFDCLVKLTEQFDRLIIIHGDADGADRLASELCSEIGIEQVKIPAVWNKYNKSSGPIRNRLMLDLFPNIDIVLAFPGGPGTANMIQQAGDRNIPVVMSLDLLQTG